MTLDLGVDSSRAARFNLNRPARFLPDIHDASAGAVIESFKDVAQMRGAFGDFRRAAVFILDGTVVESWRLEICYRSMDV